MTISCFRARKYFRHDPFSFLHSLYELKLFAFHCCLFSNDSCRSFADHIVAFGDYCSSMDAFSKTIHFEEASFTRRYSLLSNFLGFYPFPEYNFRTYPHLVFMLVAVVFLVSSEPSVIALGHHL